MSESIAQSYLELFADKARAELALLACSTALYLDDEIARDAISLIARSNGSTDALLRQVKSLGCVWEQWDGSWYVADDVRQEFLDRFYQKVPEEQRRRLREQLAEHAERRADSFTPDGQLVSYLIRQANVEAAYQRMLIPDQAEKGAAQLVEIWRHSPHHAQEALAESGDYIASDQERYLQNVLPEVLFLQGMAARARKDRAAQLKYFRAIWEKGRPGYIYGIAAHLFGLLVKDRRTAEKALRDSIEWRDSDEDRAISYHSLGNLLSKDRRRWPEAEEVYNKSLSLDQHPSNRAMRLHSLGNLLSSHPRERWPEAEDAYRESLRLAPQAAISAETWHSLGKLLSKTHRWPEAEKAYLKSLKMRTDPIDKARVELSLGDLLSKNRSRWREAEQAYERSLMLDSHPAGKAKVLSSWANFLSRSNNDDDLRKAETLAERSLELDRDNPMTEALYYHIMANVYERRGEIDQAIHMLEKQIEKERELKRRLVKREYIDNIRKRIDALHQRRRRN